MFHKPVADIGPIDEAVCMPHFSCDAKLFHQPPVSAFPNTFVHVRMCATGIGPQERTVIFTCCALLKQHLAIRIE
jgi:hypothetical protein